MLAKGHGRGLAALRRLCAAGVPCGERTSIASSLTRASTSAMRPVSNSASIARGTSKGRSLTVAGAAPSGGVVVDVAVARASEIPAAAAAAAALPPRVAVSDAAIMADEVVAALIGGPAPAGRPRLLLDCTAGDGAHAEAILRADASARLLCMHVDSAAMEATRTRLAAAGFPAADTDASGRVAFVCGSFARLGKALASLPAAWTASAASSAAGSAPQVDGVLLDSGLSASVRGQPSRGLSFRTDGQLDMRVGAAVPAPAAAAALRQALAARAAAGEAAPAADGESAAAAEPASASGAADVPVTAAELVSTLDVAALAGLIHGYGGLDASRAIAVAQAIVRWRGRGPRERRRIATSLELRFALEQGLAALDGAPLAGTNGVLAVKARRWATRRRRDADLAAMARAKPRFPAETAALFSALRVAVNGEIESLSAALTALPQHLAPGAAVAALTFQPAEDALVEAAFAAMGAAPAPAPSGAAAAAAPGATAFAVDAAAAPARAAAAEQRGNPRAAAARLRVLRRQAPSASADASAAAVPQAWVREVQAGISSVLEAVTPSPALPAFALLALEKAQAEAAARTAARVQQASDAIAEFIAAAPASASSSASAPSSAARGPLKVVQATGAMEPRPRPSAGAAAAGGAQARARAAPASSAAAAAGAAEPGASELAAFRAAAAAAAARRSAAAAPGRRGISLGRSGASAGAGAAVSLGRASQARALHTTAAAAVGRMRRGSPAAAARRRAAEEEEAAAADLDLDADSSDGAAFEAALLSEVGRGRSIPARALRELDEAAEAEENVLALGMEEAALQAGTAARIAAERMGLDRAVVKAAVVEAEEKAISQVDRGMDPDMLEDAVLEEALEMDLGGVTGRRFRRGAQEKAATAAGAAPVDVWLDDALELARLGTMEVACMSVQRAEALAASLEADVAAAGEALHDKMEAELPGEFDVQVAQLYTEAEAATMEGDPDFEAKQEEQLAVASRQVLLDMAVKRAPADLTSLLALTAAAQSARSKADFLAKWHEEDVSVGRGHFANRLSSILAGVSEDGSVESPELRAAIVARHPLLEPLWRLPQVRAVLEQGGELASIPDSELRLSVLELHQATQEAVNEPAEAKLEEALKKRLAAAAAREPALAALVDEIVRYAAAEEIPIKEAAIAMTAEAESDAAADAEEAKEAEEAKAGAYRPDSVAEALARAIEEREGKAGESSESDDDVERAAEEAAKAESAQDEAAKAEAAKALEALLSGPMPTIGHDASLELEKIMDLHLPDNEGYTLPPSPAVRERAAQLLHVLETDPSNQFSTEFLAELREMVEELFQDDEARRAAEAAEDAEQKRMEAESKALAAAKFGDDDSRTINVLATLRGMQGKDGIDQSTVAEVLSLLDIEGAGEAAEMHADHEAQLAALRAEEEAYMQSALATLAQSISEGKVELEAGATVEDALKETERSMRADIERKVVREARELAAIRAHFLEERRIDLFGDESVDVDGTAPGAESDGDAAGSGSDDNGDSEGEGGDANETEVVLSDDEDNLGAVNIRMSPKAAALLRLQPGQLADMATRILRQRKASLGFDSLETADVADSDADEELLADGDAEDQANVDEAVAEATSQERTMGAELERERSEAAAVLAELRALPPSYRVSDGYALLQAARSGALSPRVAYALGIGPNPSPDSDEEDEAEMEALLNEQDTAQLLGAPRGAAAGSAASSAAAAAREGTRRSATLDEQGLPLHPAQVLPLPRMRGSHMPPKLPLSRPGVSAGLIAKLDFMEDKPASLAAGTVIYSGKAAALNEGAGAVKRFDPHASIEALAAHNPLAASTAGVQFPLESLAKVSEAVNFDVGSAGRRAIASAVHRRLIFQDERAAGSQARRLRTLLMRRAGVSRVTGNKLSKAQADALASFIVARRNEDPILEDARSMASRARATSSPVAVAHNPPRSVVLGGVGAAGGAGAGLAHLPAGALPRAAALASAYTDPFRRNEMRSGLKEALLRERRVQMALERRRVATGRFSGRAPAAGNNYGYGADSAAGGAGQLK